MCHLYPQNEGKLTSFYNSFGMDFDDYGEKIFGYIIPKRAGMYLYVQSQTVLFCCTVYMYVHVCTVCTCICTCIVYIQYNTYNIILYHTTYNVDLIVQNYLKYVPTVCIYSSQTAVFILVRSTYACDFIIYACTLCVLLHTHR